MPQSEFEQRVFEHGAFQVLVQSLSLVQSIEKSPAEETSQENLDCLERIRLVLEETQSRLESSTKLIGEQTLNNMHGVLKQIYNYLHNYSENRDHPLCNAARGDVDQLLGYIQEIPPATPIAKRLAPTLTHLRQTLKLRGEEFQSTANQVSERLNALRDETETFLTERITAFDEKQAEIAERAELAASMVNAIAGYSLGRQYEEESRIHGEQEKRWTVAGYALVAILVATSGAIFSAPLLGWIELPATFGEGVGRFLQQSPLLGGLTAAATLVFRKAAYHRHREAEGTRLRNELVMLRAFIERLDPSEQSAVLTLVAPRYFIGGHTQVGRDDSTELAEILQRIQRKGGADSAEP